MVKLLPGDFFDYNGFGIGPDADGILLMISMEDRDWEIGRAHV